MPGGLLGADYSVENGRYRFKKVYGGLNWTPELRSPLTEPGVNVKAGRVPARRRRPRRQAAGEPLQLLREHVGQDDRDHRRPDSRRQGLAHRLRRSGRDRELALRNRDWVEGNLRKVDAATGGRVAYVYVPNTASLGYTYFKRYFYPQAYKDAVILDERYNGGGSRRRLLHRRAPEAR